MLVMNDCQLVHEAKAGSLDRVSYLLKKGAPPDTRDEDGNTALFWAACRGHAAICRVLLIHGADINGITRKTDATPIMACADNDQVSCLEGLLRHGRVEVDQSNHRGDTALHLGAYRGYIRVVRLLLHYRADPFIRNMNKRTALDEAEAQKRMECQDILRDYMDSISRRSRGCQFGAEACESIWADDEPTIHKEALGSLHPNTSLESADSAVIVSPANSIDWSINKDSASCPHPSSVTKASEGLMGYGDLENMCSYDDTQRKSCSLRNGTSHTSHSNSFSNYQHSVDSQYQSLSPSPSLSLGSRTSSSLETKLDKSWICDSKTKHCIPVTTVSGKCDRGTPVYTGPAPANDLSLNMLSARSDYLLPGLENNLNILPDKVDPPKVPPRPKRDRSSGCNRSAYGNVEMITGLHMSEFIENLQMQLLQNQSDLRQQQEQIGYLQQQMRTLREENVRLKGTIHDLSKSSAIRHYGGVTSNGHLQSSQQ